MSALAEIHEPEIQPAAEPWLVARDIALHRNDRVILDDVALTVARGEFVAVLGPRDSGKSSLVSCLLGLERCDLGVVELGGRALDRKRRADLGVVLEADTLDVRRTVRTNLAMAAALYGVSRGDATSRAGELLSFLELDDVADEPVVSLPRGVRRRVEIARALIHGPELLVFDEPLAGVPKAEALSTWRRLVALREARELSVLVMTERPGLAALCDSVIIFDRGHVVARDTPKNLLTRVGGDVLAVRTDQPELVAECIGTAFDVVPRVCAREVVVEAADVHRLVAPVVEAIGPGRAESIEVRRPHLGDAFFHLTDRALSGDPS